jgi:hypothetical protein
MLRKYGFPLSEFGGVFGPVGAAPILGVSNSHFTFV